MQKTTANVTLNIDWEALREQKTVLLAQIEVLNHRGLSHQSDHLTGILNLIDAIQDQAAEQIGEEAVFGKKF